MLGLLQPDIPEPFDWCVLLYLPQTGSILQQSSDRLIIFLQSLLLWFMLFSLLMLSLWFRLPSRPKMDVPSLLLRLQFILTSSSFLSSSLMNQVTILFSQNPSKVLANFSGSVLMSIFPAFLCLATYSLSSLMLSSQILPSLAKQVMSPARQFSPLRMLIWSCSVSICSLMNCVMLTVSFLSQTSISLYLLTVSMYSFSSQAQNIWSSSFMISCLSSSSWLWMLSRSPTKQSNILSLFLLSSSNTTMCWQHFCLVSEMMSSRLTQVGLLFQRKCCSVCSTMQLGHSGIRHSLSQQKLVRNSLGWQAQQILRIQVFWESVVWLMRDMFVRMIICYYY